MVKMRLALRANLDDRDVMSATTAEILDTAAQLVAQPAGWIQGRYCDGRGINAHAFERSKAFCSLGAIREAYRRHDEPSAFISDTTPATQALRQVIADAGYGGRAQLVYIDIWNDEHGRTQAEVVSMFKQAHAYATENMQ